MTDKLIKEHKDKYAKLMYSIPKSKISNFVFLLLRHIIREVIREGRMDGCKAHNI